MSQELFFGSLGGWVSWGLYHSYLFFFLKKTKKTKKKQTATKSMSAVQPILNSSFFAGNWGLINHLLLHHLFLSSSSHLSRFLPLLYENKNSL